MTAAVIFLVMTGLLFILLSIPLMRGRVKPNAWYGFRITETMDNPDIWYKVNAYAGKWLLITGIVTILASLILALVPGITEDGYGILVSVIMLAFLLLTVVLGVRYAKKLDTEQVDT